MTNENANPNQKDAFDDLDAQLDRTAQEEGAILREHGGGFAHKVGFHLPTIDNPEDAARAYEQFRVSLYTLAAYDRDWAHQDVAAAFLAAAIDFWQSGEMSRASDALAVFRQEADGGEDCTCPECAIAGGDR